MRDKHEMNSDTGRSPGRSRSRRRLLRAIGGGGLTLGVVVASKWHEPVVKSVVLPAHAQTSGVGCVVTLEIAVGAEASSTYAVTTGITGPASTTLTGSSTFSGSAFLEPGTYFPGFIVTGTATNTYFFGLAGSCCDQSTSGTDVTSGLTGFEANLSLIVSDDGHCSIS